MLRAHVTGGRSAAGIPPGVGLALVLHEGMPAWLHALAPILATQAAVGPTRSAGAAAAGAAAPPQDAGGRAPSLPADVLPPPRQAEVSLLLAGLVLSTLRSAHRPPCRTRADAGASR